MLGVSVGAVYDLIDAGKLPSVHPSERTVRVPEAELMDYIQGLRTEGGLGVCFPTPDERRIAAGLLELEQVRRRAKHVLEHAVALDAAAALVESALRKERKL